MRGHKALASDDLWLRGHRLFAGFEKVCMQDHVREFVSARGAREKIDLSARLNMTHLHLHNRLRKRL